MTAPGSRVDLGSRDLNRVNTKVGKARHGRTDGRTNEREGRRIFRVENER